MKLSYVLAFPILMAAPASAQDLQPALDPSTIAQGQVIAGTARGYAERGRARSRRHISDERTRQTCANGRAMVRAGNPEPELRRLLALCRKGGYN